MNGNQEHNRPNVNRRRLLIMAIAVVGMALVLPAIQRQFQLRQLRGYVNQDLRNLQDEDREQLEKLIAKLVPEASALGDLPQREPGPLFGLFQGNQRWHPLFCPESWYLWSVTDQQGQERLILFQAYPLVLMPSSSFARVFVLDSSGQIVNRTDRFEIGYRTDITDAIFLRADRHGFPCLRIQTSPWLGDATTQIYAFLPDWSLALVRLEDYQGRAIANYQTNGLAVPVRTAQQWGWALDSEDRTEVLRTLMWLSKYPGAWDRFEPDPTWEHYQEFKLLKEVRRRPGLRPKLVELSKSHDWWIREAAVLALEAAR